MDFDDFVGFCRPMPVFTGEIEGTIEGTAPTATTSTVWEYSTTLGKKKEQNANFLYIA